MLLTDKIALVTGGSRGIGKAVALAMAHEGAHVVLTYNRSARAAEAVVAEIEDAGGSARAVQSDAADPEAAEALCTQVVDEHGRIDVLVNNAGITRDGLLMRMSPTDWDDVLRTNLTSVYNLSKPVSYAMLRKRTGGSIINMTSIVGMRGQAGQTNYAASKAGIIGFTKSLADELGGRDIRVNAIAPGFIRTDMTDELSDELRDSMQATIPMKRLGEPDEVARVAVFLASDLAAYVTGQVISVCGGMNR